MGAGVKILSVEGLQGTFARRGWGCSMLDRAGSSQLQWPHHRVWLGLAAKMAAPWVKWIKNGKGKPNRQGRRKKVEVWALDAIL